MAQGDRITTSNLQIGVFWTQPGKTFTETEPGQWDTGLQQYLTVKGTTPDNSANYPRVGQVSPDHPYMQVFQVDELEEESGLKEITIYFRGFLYANGGNPTKPHNIVKSVSASMVTLPALTGGGSSLKRSLVVPVPMPTFHRTYITSDPFLMLNPFYGVGNPAPTGVNWLPPPGAWGISYLPDPDEPLPVNYYFGWMLMGRDMIPSVNIGTPVSYLVDEVYQWFWPFSA